MRPPGVHCQKDTAAAIRDAGADYLLCVKDDFGGKSRCVKTWSCSSTTLSSRQTQGCSLTRWRPDNGHGRLDQRSVWAGGEVGWLRRRHPDWRDLRGIVRVDPGSLGRRLDFATGKTSVRRRFYLTSLDPREAGAQRPGELVRGHWSVENNLHWCLDVSMGDDRARVRKDHGPVNLAAVKRLCPGLVRRSTPPASTPLKARRYLCGLLDNYLIKTLTGGDRG